MTSKNILKGLSESIINYFVNERKEMGFDLSSPNQPYRRYPPRRERTLIDYNDEVCKPVKMYFSSVDLRKKLTTFNCDTINEERIELILKKLEVYIRSKTKEDLALKRLHFEKKSPWNSSWWKYKPLTFQHSRLMEMHYNSRRRLKSRNIYNRYNSSLMEGKDFSRINKLHRKKKTKDRIYGSSPILRTVPHPVASRGEAERLVNYASRLLFITENYNPLAYQFSAPGMKIRSSKHDENGLLVKALSKKTSIRSRSEKDSIRENRSESIIKEVEKNKSDSDYAILEVQEFISPKTPAFKIRKHSAKDGEIDGEGGVAAAAEEVTNKMQEVEHEDRDEEDTGGEEEEEEELAVSQELTTTPTKQAGLITEVMIDDMLPTKSNLFEVSLSKDTIHSDEMIVNVGQPSHYKKKSGGSCCSSTSVASRNNSDISSSSEGNRTKLSKEGHHQDPSYVEQKQDSQPIQNLTPQQQAAKQQKILRKKPELEKNAALRKEQEQQSLLQQKQEPDEQKELQEQQESKEQEQSQHQQNPHRQEPQQQQFMPEIHKNKFSDDSLDQVQTDDQSLSVLLPRSNLGSSDMVLSKLQSKSIDSVRSGSQTVLLGFKKRAPQVSDNLTTEHQASCKHSSQTASWIHSSSGPESHEEPLLHNASAVVSTDIRKRLKFGENNNASRKVKQSFSIKVVTGDRIGASTNAEVWIFLIGDRNKLPRAVQLTKSRNRRRPFQRSSIDVFHLKSSRDLGFLRALQIGHDSTLPGSDWFLESVSVLDENRQFEFVFPCSRWLSVRAHDSKTRLMLEYRCSNSSLVVMARLNKSDCGVQCEDDKQTSPDDEGVTLIGPNRFQVRPNKPIVRSASPDAVVKNAVLPDSDDSNEWSDLMVEVSVSGLSLASGMQSSYDSSLSGPSRLLVRRNSPPERLESPVVPQLSLLKDRNGKASIDVSVLAPAIVDATDIEPGPGAINLPLKPPPSRISFSSTGSYSPNFGSMQSYKNTSLPSSVRSNKN